MLKITLIFLAIGIVALLITRQGREVVAGICAVALDQTIRKSANKERIVAMLAERGSITNAEVVELLQVSPRTVVNYMDELEAEGKVQQMGITGQNVVYRLKITA